jgi:hypothetical protein
MKVNCQTTADIATGNSFHTIKIACRARLWFCWAAAHNSTHCVLPPCRQFADDFHKLGRPLHVLVNNGGIHLKVRL